jgi:AraC family transcriptional regulator
MILTRLPDLPPRPETDANAEFRRRFYARWGRENAVICGRSTSAEYATMTQALSIKMAWDGRERYRLPNRDVSVDDDSYLILNEGSAYGSVLKTGSPTWTFAMFMRPGMHREVHAARAMPADRALGEPEPRSAPVGFSEHLHRHDEVVTPRLCAIRDAVLAGERSEDWLEEQLLLLLDAMFASEEADAAKVRSLARAKPSTRREIARRLRLAADYMDSCHAEAIDLDSTARVACLSRFHLVRFFRALYGVTPHVYLLQRRTAVARRLLGAGEDDLDTVAAQAGFGSRSSLRRALARHP